MSRDLPRGVLIGRAGERRLLVDLLDRARHDLSGVLVGRGEAGIGKTARTLAGTGREQPGGLAGACE